MTKPKKKTPDDKVLYEGVELLPVPLTEKELLDRGQQLAQVDADIGAHNEHADSVKKDLKAKEQALSSERARLANVVRQKREPRQVTTSGIARWKENIVETVRADTDEVIRRRPLEAHERQQILDLGMKKSKPGPEPTSPLTSSEEAALERDANPSEDEPV